MPVKIKSELRNLPTTVRSKHVDWLTPQLRGCLACSSGDAHRFEFFFLICVSLAHTSSSKMAASHNVFSEFYPLVVTVDKSV